MFITGGFPRPLKRSNNVDALFNYEQDVHYSFTPLFTLAPVSVNAVDQHWRSAL
ncbi:hypothetical protein PANA5342_2002 [Pantoea ananatis LMG 5342]|nr:hypothetical protein PANA5342_2002 [Pantoea ananatis LMG 5342]